MRPSKGQRIIGLGSDRAAKVAALDQAIARIATIDPSWSDATVIAKAVEVSIPAMPLTDDELQRGARERAQAARALLETDGNTPDLCVGLEGGFHTLEFDGIPHTYLRGWAYATDGKSGWFGGAPSIEVPQSIAQRVIAEGLELGILIDQIAGENDVRSRQGTWGILSRDLLTRSMSFEAALIAALAPFYNAPVYS